jgi:hypothetical protein
MARKTKRNIPKKSVSERQRKKDLKIVQEILDAWGVELDDEIRYRRQESDGTWSRGVKVVGINRDMSLLCFEEGRSRSFLPGFAFDIEVRRRGPRGGETWEALGQKSDA